MNALVLIVEDDEDTRRRMANLVSLCGHDTITAATISEGMERLGSMPSHLLLDMNLPDGFGTTILRHVRDRNLPIKVAVVSGTRDNALVEEANRLRPDAFFEKPADVDALMDWIAA